MRLGEFILRDMEAILVEWEAFAATLFPAAAELTPLSLRDHAQQILMAIAKDLSTSQTRRAQADKSKGLAQGLAGAPETAAETHAVLRAQSGFDINQLVAEYRALRASVLRLWTDACQPDDLSLVDVVRFNEGIDQAIAESIQVFSAEVEEARNLLLGMVGHDMRSPLNTILLTGSYLAALDAGPNVSNAASRLTRSGNALNALLNDLVDYNRARFGLGVPVALTDTDLAAVFTAELDQLRVAHPGHSFELEVTGDVQGRWDGPRLQQMLRNLVSNAVKYGSADTPVRVVVVGEQEEVRWEVANNGTPIEQSSLEEIFDPLQRGPGLEESDANGSLGLGLYIVREIAHAHGGEVDVRSEAGETTFGVRLPRSGQVPDR